MLKRLLCLALSCLLVGCTFVPAGAEESYTAAQKFLYQLEAGSGLKGTADFTFTALDGSAAPADGMTAAFSAITTHGITQVVADLAKDDFAAQLVGYAENGLLYLTCDLLSDGVYAVQTDAQQKAVEWLTNANLPGLPAWMVMLLTDTDEERKASLEAYLADAEMQLDLWVAGFTTGSSTIKTANGFTQMVMEYQIPADALKAQMKTLLKSVLADENMLSLLRSYMTEEEQTRYLNGVYQFFYENMIDSMALSRPLDVIHTFSVEDNTSVTDMYLPLSLEQTGFSGLKITIGTQLTDGITIVLEAKERTYTAQIDFTQSEDMTVFTGRASCLPDAGAESGSDCFAFTFSGMYTIQTYTDENDKINENYTLALNIKEDTGAVGTMQAGSYTQVNETDVSLSAAFRSGQAKNVSTSVTYDLSVTGAGVGSMNVSGTAKTASPWGITQLDTENARMLDSMTSEELTALVQQLLGNLSPVLPTPAPIMTPVPTQTPTDVPTQAPTATPTQAPTDVPTQVPTATPTQVPTEEPTDKPNY